MHARSKVSLLALSLALGLAALRPTPVSAQASTGELRDEMGAHRLAAENGFYVFDYEDIEFAVLQQSLYGSFRVADFGGGAYLDVDAAWRFASSFGDLDSEFRAGNPFVGARFGLHDVEQGWRVRGGLGVTLPLMNLYDDYVNPFASPELAAVSFGAQMQGQWDQFLLRPLTSSIVARGDFEYRQQYFDVGAELGLAAMLPVEYRGETGTGEWLAQGGVWAAGRPIEALSLGARFHAVMTHAMNDTDGADGFYALSPYIRGEWDRSFVEGRAVLNFGSSIEPFYEDGGVWAVYVQTGASF